MGERSDDHAIGGFHAVTAALQRRRAVTAVWLAAHRDDKRVADLRALADRLGIEIRQAAMADLDAMLPDVRHQGCVAQLAAAVAPDYRESDLPALLAGQKQPWVLALDQVQDPHNLGACLRSAAAAGVSAVIAPRKRAVGLTPAVHKVAAGAAERVPFVPVTNLARAIKRLQAEGFWAVGLAGEAERSLHATDLTGPLIVVLGGEARGLRERTRTTCDLLAAIPMHNDMESLNVSVATGVVLFEALRQRSL